MPNEDFLNFLNYSQIIKKLRKKKRLSQTKLGKKIGLSFQAISSYESGRTIPTLNVFMKILWATGYTIEIKENIFKSIKPVDFN